MRVGWAHDWTRILFDMVRLFWHYIEHSCKILFNVNWRRTHACVSGKFGFQDDTNFVPFDTLTSLCGFEEQDWFVRYPAKPKWNHHLFSKTSDTITCKKCLRHNHFDLWASHIEEL